MKNRRLLCEPHGVACLMLTMRSTACFIFVNFVKLGTNQMAVVAGHAASSAGHLASKGAYQSTRVSMRAWNNLMSRNQTPETSAQASGVESVLLLLVSCNSTVCTGYFSLLCMIRLSFLFLSGNTVLPFPDVMFARS